MLSYFNFEPSFKLRWCRARDLLGFTWIYVVTGICDPSKSRARHHRNWWFEFMVFRSPKTYLIQKSKRTNLVLWTENLKKIPRHLLTPNQILKISNMENSASYCCILHDKILKIPPFTKHTIIKYLVSLKRCQFFFNSLAISDINVCLIHCFDNGIRSLKLQTSVSIHSSSVYNNNVSGSEFSYYNFQLRQMTLRFELITRKIL